MSTSDRLDEIEQRCETATPAQAETSLSMDGFNMHEDYPEYGQGQLMNAYMLGYDEGCADKSALLAALRAVLDLHRPVEVEPSDTICGDCSFQLPNGRYFGKVEEWPCPTVRAIATALGEEARNGQ